MGRIKKYIDIGKDTYWTLFDTDARNIYITPKVVSKLPSFDLSEPNPVSL